MASKEIYPFSFLSGGASSFVEKSLGGAAGVVATNSFFDTDQYVDLPLITSNTTVFAPVISSNDATVQLPAIVSNTTVHPIKVGKATWTARAGVSMTTNVGGFYEYKPPFYDDGISACFICFHGQGEQGDGNANLGLLLNQGVSKMINNTMGTVNQFPYDALVICPQYTGGAMTSGRVQGIIDYVRANFTFNQAKLHLTALSLGSEGLTNWWFNGTLTHVASCSILCTPSQFYQPGADNAVAADMPTLFVHGTADSNPFTPFTRSQRWVEGYAPNGWPGLNGLGISPPSIYYPMVGYDHNCWQDFYESINTRSFLIGGKDWVEWGLQYNRLDGVSLPLIVSNANVFNLTLEGGDRVVALPTIVSSTQVFSPTVINDNSWILVHAASIPGLNRPSLAALSSSRVVLHDEGNDKLSILDWNGTNFEELASITVAGSGGGHVAGLSTTEFAYIDGSLKKLRRYAYSGGSISLVGSELDLSGLSPALNAPAIAALSSTRIVLVDQGNMDLRAYDWVSNAWVAVGTPYTAAGGFAPDIVGLTSSRVVVWHGNNGRLTAYDFNGSTFTLYAETEISYSTSAIGKLSSSRLCYINDGIDTLAVIDLVGTSFVDQGITLALSNVFYPALAGLDINHAVFIDQNNDELRVYQYSYSGPTDQNVDLPVIVSSSSVNALVIQPDAVAVQLPAITSTVSVFSPVITPQPVDVQLPAIVSNTTVFGLVVDPQPVTVDLGLISVGTNVFPPSISVVDVAVSLPSIVSTAQVNAFVITVDGGPQFVLLPAIVSTSLVNDLLLEPGPVSIDIPVIVSISTVYDLAMVADGSVGLPLIVSNTNVFPLVLENEKTIVLPLITSTLQVYPLIIGTIVGRAKFRVTLID
jgi:hypothetical protein